MKKLISLFCLLLFISSLAFTRGKADSELPPENDEYAFQGNEGDEKTDEPLLPKYTLRPVEGNPIQVKESWGYVMQNRVEEYDNSIPLTDVCFFSAEVNCYGELTGVPNR